MQAQWIQIALRLTRPQGPPIDLCSGNCERLGPIVSTAPPVQRITDFELHLRQREGVTPWRTVDSVPVRVYPLDLIAPLETWARENTLLVRDRAGKLSSFLHDREIPFVTRPGPRSSGRATVVFVTGDADPLGVLDAQAPRRVVHLLDEVRDYPKIVARHDGRIHLVRVEMALLDSLHGPRGQTILLDAFRMSLNTEGKDP